MSESQRAGQNKNPLIAAGLKHCTGCGQWKLKDDFHRNRRTADGLQPRCKVCKNWAAHLQRVRDTGRLRLQQEAWVRANAAYVKKRMARWRLLKRDEINAAKREKYAKGYATEPHKYLSYVHKRRSSADAAGSYTQEEWTALCAHYGHKCLCCDAKTVMTVDHVVPLSKGGTNTIDNLQPLCVYCNKQKHSKVMDFRVFHDISYVE